MCDTLNSMPLPNYDADDLVVVLHTDPDDLYVAQRPPPTCRTCHERLTDARLLAVPDAVQCVACVTREGDEPPLVGVMTWEHKTAPSIEIGTRFAVAEAGAKHSYGPHFWMPSTSNPKLAKEVEDETDERIEADLVREVSGAKLRATTYHDAPILEPVSRRAARCHPDRPAVVPSGHCLDCATAWYTRRKRC